MPDQPTDKQIFEATIAADDEGLVAGEEPRGRSISTVARAMTKLGFDNFVFAGIGRHPIVDCIHNLMKNLYRPQDLSIGGIHLATFMFRDVFARISVPLGFGKAPIDPFRQVDLSENQLRWLASRPADLDAYLDQFADAWDFGWGLMDLEHEKGMPEESKNLLGLAHFQLQAAAAIVTGAYDYRGAVQSSLIAAELALKGGLAAHGYDEKALVALGHNLTAAAEALEKLEPSLDGKRIRATVSRFPKFVANRYSAAQPTRCEVGHIVMGAQYVAAEVMRQFSDRDFRSEAKDYPARSYPPLDV